MSGAWNNLTMREKAGFIKIGVDNGLTSLSDIQNAYNKFAQGGQEETARNTPLSDQEYYTLMEKQAEINAPKWGVTADEAFLHMLNDNTYNYRGYYNKYPNSKANADTHWTDEFKTAFHPTFSKESIYSGKKSQYNPEGKVGGTWIGDMFILNTKALGGHIYDGETEDSQQIETTKPSIIQKIKLGLANLDNEVLGRALLAGQALLDTNPNKRKDAKYGLTHGKEDLGKGNDIYYLNGLPQSTFLLPEWERQILFENAGWHRLPNGSYNLVNKAASKYGKALPTYQSGPDAIDRNQLTAFGNLLTDLPIVKGDYELPDANSRPSTLYIGPDNKIYVREEDLNDYSNIGLLGRALDKVGNPLVVTTGIQPYIYGGKHIDMQDLFNAEAPGAEELDRYMQNQGLRRERINGKWQFVTPDVTVTPNGYAWGGNLYGDGGKKVIKNVIPSETPVDPYTGDIFDEYGNRGNYSIPGFENFEVVGNQASSHEFAEWLREQARLDTQKDPYTMGFLDYYYSTHPTSQEISNTAEAGLRQKAHQEGPTTIVEPSIVLDTYGVPKINYSVPFTIDELYETDPIKYRFSSSKAKVNKDKQEMDYYFHQTPTFWNLLGGLRSGFNYLHDAWINPSGYERDAYGNIVYMDYAPLLGDWGKSYDILNSIARRFSENSDLALTPEILAEVEKQLGYSEKIAKIEGVNGRDVSAHEIIYPESNDPMIDLTFLPITKKYGLMLPRWGGFTKMRGKHKKGIGINGNSVLNRDTKNFTRTLVHEKRHVLEQDYKLMPYQENTLDFVYPTTFSPIERDASKTISEKAATNAEIRYYLDQKGYDINKIIDEGPEKLKDIFIEENPETGEIITIFDKMQKDGYKISGYMADYNRNIKEGLKNKNLNKDALNWGFAHAIRIVPSIAGAVGIGGTLKNEEK